MCFIYRLLEAGWRSCAESSKWPHISTNLRVTTCKNPAIAVAKAISTVVKLNKKKREDSKQDCDNMVCVYFSSHLQVIKKHLILNNAVLSRLIDSIYYTCQYILGYKIYSALFCEKNGEKCSIYAKQIIQLSLGKYRKNMINYWLLSSSVFDFSAN